MERLLILICLLLIASPCLAWIGPVVAGGGVAADPTGITYIGSGSGSTNATHIHIAMDTSTASGDLLVVLLKVSSGGYEIPAVGVGTFEDDRGNTWTLDVAGGAPTDMPTGIYSAIAKDSGTVTITATVAGNTDFGGSIVAFRNITNNTPEDTADAKAGSTNQHAGDIVTAGAAVIVGIMRTISTAATIDQDVNWTLLYENEASNQAFSTCYRIVTSGGTYNDGWTLSSSLWSRASTAAYK